MAKPELGTKRLCAHCGARFYDLKHTPITCPKCGAAFEAVQVASRGGRGEAARAAVREVGTGGAQRRRKPEGFVSLEEGATPRRRGKKKPGEAAEEGEEESRKLALDDESLADPAFSRTETPRIPTDSRPSTEDRRGRRRGRGRDEEGDDADRMNVGARRRRSLGPARSKRND